jgi:hypothetical protein
MPPSKIMIIRHGEKPEDGDPEPGLNANGAVDPTSLTGRGWRRARALVGFFAEPNASGIATPAKIFAAKPNENSQRPMQTISLTANALWPDPATRALRFDATHDQDDFDGLINGVMSSDGVCLVCWEHKRIPAIADKIPHVPAAPTRWPGHRFDVVWIFDAALNARAFSQTPENLLAGDRDKIIENADS